MIRLFIVALCLIAAGCGSSIEQLVVADNAYDVSNRRSAAEWEISYKAKVEFPTSAVTDAAFSSLSAQGWRLCKGPTNGREWETFSDHAKGAQRWVHQKIEYWSKEDQLLLIGLAYYSKNGAHSIKPDNDEQHVHVRMMRGRSERARALSLSCE